MKREVGEANLVDGDHVFHRTSMSTKTMHQETVLSSSEQSHIRLIKIRSVSDSRGILSVADSGDDLPFVPRRVYWLHGGSIGTVRGGHAHRKLEQLLVAMHGVYEIAVDDGERRQTVRLETPTDGLLISPIVWREIRQMSLNSSLAVLASLPFDPEDYIHDYTEFLNLCGSATC
jgi:hypothetical protein